MDNVEAITEILPELNICRDLHQYVLDYLFVKCCECRKFKNKGDLNDKWNGKSVCDVCIMTEDYNNCFYCQKHFKPIEGNYCIRCHDKCIVNCPDCSVDTDIN